jgi:divalent metal cation (Fe/Co/Zn/Cd) transporter
MTATFPTKEVCIKPGVVQFAVTDLFASLLWSAVYMAIGLLGGVLFAKPWQGMVTVMVLVVVVSVAGQLVLSYVDRLRGRRLPGSDRRQCAFRSAVQAACNGRSDPRIRKRGSQALERPGSHSTGGTDE